MAKVLVTTVASGELVETTEHNFPTTHDALEYANSVKGKGRVGCVKDGDKIVSVF